MVFGLLATEVPEERRSATLNLVYLPLYAAGIIGPIIGAIVVGIGIWAPFAVAAAVFLDRCHRNCGHDGPGAAGTGRALIRATPARTHRRAGTSGAGRRNARCRRAGSSWAGPDQ